MDLNDFKPTESGYGYLEDRFGEENHRHATVEHLGQQYNLSEEYQLIFHQPSEKTQAWIEANFFDAPNIQACIDSILTGDESKITEALPAYKSGLMASTPQDSASAEEILDDTALADTAMEKEKKSTECTS